MICTIEYPNQNIQIKCSIEQQYEPNDYFTRNEIQQGTDVDLHNYPGCLLTFQNGEQLKVLYYENNQIKYLVQGQWIDIQQIDEQIKPLIQSFEQQKKEDMIKFELINFDFNQKYIGYLKSGYISKQTNNIFQMEELFKDIQNINSENNQILKFFKSPQGYEIIITLFIQKMNTSCTYQLSCKLNLSNNKEDQKLIDQLKVERKIKQLESQIFELQKLNKIDHQVNLSEFKKIENKIGFYKTDVYQQQGLYELKLQLVDEQIHFKIIVLANGDEENFLNPSRCYSLSFPLGNFCRGTQKEEQYIHHPFITEDVIKIIVDTKNNFIKVDINGWSYAPVRIGKFDSFAFQMHINENKTIENICYQEIEM